MRLSLQLPALVLAQAIVGAALPTSGTSAERRDAAPAVSGPQFANGQPDDGNGRGGPLLGKTISHANSVVKCQRLTPPTSGGTNRQIDIANPDNLGQQSTDAGIVPNLKWRFSDSKTRLFKGGWLREQVIQDLPQSHDISAAQQHLSKGAIRELHWHRVVSDPVPRNNRNRIVADMSCRRNGVSCTRDPS